MSFFAGTVFYSIAMVQADALKVSIFIAEAGICHTFK